MICKLGESTVSLSKEDVLVAIENFLNEKIIENKPYKVKSMIIHRAGSKKSLTVNVSRRDKYAST